MRYSEIELMKLLKAEYLSLEDEVKFNILIFIRAIHLNQQNFIESAFRSEYFGDLRGLSKKIKDR